MRMLLLVLSLAMVCAAVRSEDATPPARPDFRNMSAEERTAYFVNLQKKALGVTDEEFKALQPKIDEVTKAQAAQRGGGGGFGGFGGGGRGGRGGQGGQPQDEATKGDIQKKTEALQKLLDNKDSDVKDVQAALKDLRDARTANKVVLKKAQDELKELLTAKQEAYLVLRGQLE